MNKTARVAFILAAFFFIYPALGQADIVYTRNGDKLFGVIQNPSFSWQLPLMEATTISRASSQRRHALLS